MPSQRPYSEIRASDAERERVVAYLRKHALEGRLDNEELEERIGQAYAARYVGDLERLIADLPRPHAPAAPRRPAHVHQRRRRHEPTPALIVAGVALLCVTGLPFAVMAGVVAVIAVIFALSMVLGPFLLIALLIVAASKRHHRPPPPPRWGRVY
jgi:Flp pilus assembly protein TadB